MTLQGRITALAQAIGLDVKRINSTINGFSSATGAFGPYTLVTTLTSAGIQAAHDAASPGDTLMFKGVYACSSNVNLTKNLQLIGLNATFDGGTVNNQLLTIHGVSNLLIDRIKFQPTSTASGRALILFDEFGDSKNVTIQNCKFTAPGGGAYNAISVNNYSEVSSSGSFVDNLKILNNDGYDLPRMFFEIACHNWSSSTILVSNITASGNQINNIGNATDDGMGISVSGPVQHVIVNDNHINGFRGYGIEFIGTLDFSASGNQLYTTKTFGGSNNYGSNGYNLTDGTRTEQAGISGKGAQRGSITGGTVNVSGRPVQMAYATDITFAGEYWKGGAFVLMQHCDRLTFAGVNMQSAYQVCLYFDGTSNSNVIGGRYSTENAVGGKYEQIGFYNSSANNFVSGASLFGVSDNGLNIKQDGSTTSNRWSGVYVNGTLLSSATASGSIHYCRVTFPYDGSGNNGFAASQGYFQKASFSTVNSDADSCWDPANNQYVVKEAGVYEIITKFRLGDNVGAGKSYGQGVTKSLGDNASFMWFVGTTTRNSSLNATTLACNVGDTLMLQYSLDSFNAASVQLEMTIYKIG